MGLGLRQKLTFGPHSSDRIMQVHKPLHLPFYHFLPSCIPILLSISTNFSPSPLPPSSILRKRRVFLIFSQVARRNLPGIRCSRMLPIPPQVDSQGAHNQLTKTRVCNVVYLKKKLEWVPWWILCFIVPQWSVQCCYTSCRACPETCTCHEYDPALCTWGKGTLLGLGSSGVTALARQLVPWLEPLHWLGLILLLLLGPSCPSLPPEIGGYMQLQVLPYLGL